MISLERVLMGSALLLILGSAYGQEERNVFAQGGSQPGAAPCVACHGADGLGLAVAGFPRLAGLPAGYLRRFQKWGAQQSGHAAAGQGSD